MERKNISVTEGGILFAAALVYIAINVLTAHWFPLPWVDEVMYTDPSINFVQGRGFTSTAWPSIPSTVYWPGNTPLHEWILIVWLKVFGVSATSARSINALFVSITVLVLTWACRRLGLLRSSAALMSVAFLMFCGIGMAHIARDGRPDGIKALFAALGLLAYSAPPPYRRYALFVAGLFFVPAGFQVVAFAIVACVVAWILLGKSFFWDGFALGLGCIAGLLLLLGIFATQGVSKQFLENTLASGHTITGDLAQSALFGDEKVKKRLGGRMGSLAKLPEIYAIDPIHPWLILFCLASAIVLIGTKRITWRGAAVGAFLVALLAPPITVLTGKYFMHYTWIGAIPLILATGFYLDRMPGSIQSLCCILVLLAGIFGFPAELIMQGSAGKGDFENIEKFVSEHISQDDSVYAGSAVYYPVKAKAKAHFSTEYAGGRGLPSIPDAERESITVLLVPTSRLDAAKEKVGGEWEDTGLVLPLPTGTSEEPEYVLYRRKGRS